MCGRKRCTLDPSTVRQATGVPQERWRDAERYRPSYNVSPGSYMPVVYATDQGKNRVVHCMKWGLVPSFTKKGEKPDFFRMFNARSETVDTKASFRRLLGRNRCVAMAEGFYEWKKDGAKKQPYYIHFKDGRPMLFAALFDCWEDDQGQPLYTYTVLTTAVSKRLDWLHDRMPAILGDSDAVERWLGDSEDVKKCIAPYNRDDLVWYAVTPNMGRMSFDGPECVAEVKPTTAGGSAIAKLFGKKTTTSVSPKAGPPPQDESMPGDGGEHMTDEELKAFNAALHPDEDTRKPSNKDHTKAPEEEPARQSTPLSEAQAEARTTAEASPSPNQTTASGRTSFLDSADAKQIHRDDAPCEPALWGENEDAKPLVEYISCITQSGREPSRETRQQPFSHVKEEEKDEGVEVGAGESQVSSSLGEKRKLGDDASLEAFGGSEHRGVAGASPHKKAHKEFRGDAKDVPSWGGSTALAHGKTGGKGSGVDKRGKDEGRGKQKTLLSFFGKSG